MSRFTDLLQANKAAWLIRYQHVFGDIVGNIGYGVGVEDPELARDWGHDRTDRTVYRIFEPLDATPVAHRSYPPIGFEDHRQPTEVDPDDWHQFLIRAGYQPLQAEEIIRQIAEDHRAEPTPHPRRARRPARRPVRRFEPIPPPTYVSSKRKVAFSFPEMVEFAYGGLARGGQDYLKRGRNDRLVRAIHDEDTIEVNYYLFDNLIAILMVEKDPDPTQPMTSRLELSDAGWKTVTTKDRLSTLLETAGIPFFIIQHQWEWYLARRDLPSEQAWRRENWIDWDGGKPFEVMLG